VYERTDFKHLLEIARKTLAENGLEETESMQAALKASDSDKGALIMYLNAMLRLPHIEDKEAIRLEERLATQIDQGRFEGIEIVFDAGDDPFPDRIVDFVFLRDFFLRSEIEDLITRIEGSY
jgi:hypothetical protein